MEDIFIFILPIVINTPLTSGKLVAGFLVFRSLVYKTRLETNRKLYVDRVISFQWDNFRIISNQIL